MFLLHAGNGHWTLDKYHFHDIRKHINILVIELVLSENIRIQYACERILARQEWLVGCQQQQHLYEFPRHRKMNSQPVDHKTVDGLFQINRSQN